MTKTELMVSPDCNELFTAGCKYAQTQLPNVIIAVGDGSIQDCAAAISCLTEIPFISLPETAPTAFKEYDTLDIFLYKNLPEICIIDPSFINNADSMKIAYEGLGMMCLALEGSIFSPDRFIKTAAAKSLVEIYNNLVPAFRGEISARENLCKAMYGAYTAYINSFDYSWQSPGFRTAGFFSRWQAPGLSILAVSISTLVRFYIESDFESVNRISKIFAASPYEEFSVLDFADTIRRLQAVLGIPFALRSFGVDESEFLAFCRELSEDEKDLYAQCYYGNISFVKK